MELPPRWARMTLALCAAAALFEGFDNQSMGVAAPRVIAEFALSTGQASHLYLQFGDHRIISRRRHRRPLCGLHWPQTNPYRDIAAIWVLLTADGARGGSEDPVGSHAIPDRPRLGRRDAELHCSFIGVHARRSAHQRGDADHGGDALRRRIGGGSLLECSDVGWNWRVIFYIGGVVPIVTAILMMRPATGFPKKRRRHAIAAGASRKPLLHAVQPRPEDRRQACSGRGFSLPNWCSILMLNWLPSLVIGLGFTRSQASWTVRLLQFGRRRGAGFLGKLHVQEAIAASGCS